MANLQWSDLVGRGETAGQPAAGIPGRLYYNTDDSTLYRDNGSEWENVEGPASLSNPMTDAGDMIVGGTAGTPTGLPKGVDGKLLSMSAGAIEWANPPVGGGYPHQIRIPLPVPNAVSGAWTVTVNGNDWYGSHMTSGNASTDYAEWLVLMASGTWRIDVVSLKGSNRGIITVSIDGISVGTCDFYNASDIKNVVIPIIGISIATSGIKTIRLATATKNASSTAYYMTPCMVHLLRTGD